MISACLATLAVVTAAVPQASPDEVAQYAKSFESTASAEKRIELLDDLARMQGDEATRAAITAILVDGLRDSDRHGVRMHAAELIRTPPDASVAIEGLLEVTARSVEEQVALLEELATRLDAANRINADSDANPIEQLTASVHVLETLEKQTGLIEFQAKLATALAVHRDDRCVATVALLLPLVLQSEETLTVVDALLAFGTRPAVEAVVGTFEGAERVLDDRKSRRKALARERPRKKPSGSKGTSNEWRDAERKRLEAQLAEFDSQTESLERRTEAIAERLAAFARANGVGRPPRGTRKSSWLGWWKRNRDSLPLSVAD